MLGEAPDDTTLCTLFPTYFNILYDTLTVSPPPPSLPLLDVKPPRKNRGELAKSVDADYYGYRDEEDGVIVPLEQEAERKGTNYRLYAH